MMMLERQKDQRRLLMNDDVFTLDDLDPQKKDKD